MINFRESMENLIGQLEGTGMEMLDLAQYKIKQIEKDKAELDELVIEQRDRIIHLHSELDLLREDRDRYRRLCREHTETIASLTARLNNRLGG